VPIGSNLSKTTVGDALKLLCADIRVLIECGLLIVIEKFYALHLSVRASVLCVVRC
jgi:hypothetical protein